MEKTAAQNQNSFSVLDKKDEGAEQPESRVFPSPWMVLLITSMAIFSCETLLMLFLYTMPYFTPLEEGLLDGFILTLVLFPIILFLVYKPLVSHIAQRNLATKALRESEEQYRIVAETASDGIVTVDESGKILFVNHAVEEIFGYTSKEMLGNNITMLMPDNLKDVHSSAFKRYLETGKRTISWKTIDLPGKHKNGKEVSLGISFGEYIKEGKHTFTSVIRDITSRKKIEKQRKELLKDLSRTNVELENFAYIVSHDLKSPLRGISCLSEWLAEDHAHVLNEEGRENLELLTKRTKRMSSLIDGILKYSRVGRDKLELGHLDSDKVVREVIESLETPEGISVRVVGTMPEIVYDGIHLKQVFQNLVDNGIVHLGKPRGEVVVSCRDSGETWEFCVRDNGIGIADKHFERIFKMFQSLKAHEDSRSTGIGLSLVKKIVESHGGTVWLESTLGEGSQFFFTVPKEPKNKMLERVDPRKADL